MPSRLLDRLAFRLNSHAASQDRRMLRVISYGQHPDAFSEYDQILEDQEELIPSRPAPVAGTSWGNYQPLRGGVRMTTEQFVSSFAPVFLGHEDEEE